MDSRGSGWMLLGILALHGGWFFLAGPHFGASDDLAYMDYARALERGDYALTASHFNNRLAVFAPVALLFRWLGYGPVSAALWPLAASLLTIVTLFAVTRRLAGPATALTAAFLLAVNPLQIEVTLQLLPDPIVTACVLLGAAALCFGRVDGLSRGAVVLWASTLPLALLIAFMGRESAVWVIPFLVTILIHDLWAARHRLFWQVALAGGLGLLLLYLGIYWSLTGDPLFRIRAVNAARTTALQLHDHQDLLHRLTLGPLVMLLTVPGLAFPALLALPAWIRSGLERRHAPETAFWGLFLLLLLLTWWFGSSSLSLYRPMPLTHPRYLQILLPLLTLFAALSLTREGRGPGLGSGLALLLLLGVGFVASAHLGLMKKHLLLAALPVAWGIVATLPVFQNRAWSRWLYRAILGVAFLGIPLLAQREGLLGEGPAERTERHVVQQHLARLTGPVVVYTDHRTLDLLPFYFSRQVPDNIHLARWETLGAPEQAGRVPHLLLHRQRLLALGSRYGQDLPDFVTAVPPTWQRLAGSAEIGLYRLPAGGGP
ncbi:MAG: hypothetical protein HQL82_07790 [Magnetococcales bacterium]|nr:hypothetical protein [Magnetococcales bacterium]